MFSKFYTELSKEQEQVKRLPHHLSPTTSISQTPPTESENESKDLRHSKPHISWMSHLKKKVPSKYHMTLLSMDAQFIVGEISLPFAASIKKRLHYL